MLYIDFKRYSIDQGDFSNKKMNEQIKKYIEKILGISVQFYHWRGELELPFYITERYDMRLAELDDIRCIFLKPKDKLNQIGSLKRQIRRIQLEEALPVVFVFERMDPYHRDAFIHAHFPFIVTGSQLYLPFMGMYLQKKYMREIKASDAFQSFTQLLLFYWYDQQENCLYMNDMAKILGCSAMTVTRAFRQLEETGLFETGKNGVKKYIKGKEERKVILKQLEDVLSSPVAETVYINREELEDGTENSEYFFSGNSALVRIGIEAEQKIPCYAVNKKTFHLSGSKELLNAETQAEVQLWKYDPSILAKNGIVDPLSLALSFQKPLDSFLKND